MPFTGDSHFVTCARDGQIRLADLSSAGICKGTKKLAQHRGAAHKVCGSDMSTSFKCYAFFAVIIWLGVMS